jgi:hypothetical protein
MQEEKNLNSTTFQELRKDSLGKEMVKKLTQPYFNMNNVVKEVSLDLKLLQLLAELEWGSCMNLLSLSTITISLMKKRKLLVRLLRLLFLYKRNSNKLLTSRRRSKRKSRKRKCKTMQLRVTCLKSSLKTNLKKLISFLTTS